MARLICVGILLWGAVASAADLQNATYRIHVLKDNSAQITAGPGFSRTFSPTFTILYAAQDPQLSYERAKEEAYLVPAWKSRQGGQTMDLFQADAQAETVQGQAVVSGSVIRWEFPDVRSGKLEAQLSLPAGGDPEIQFRFTPGEDGWYSIGYTGAPAVPREDVEALWQPLVWQERRFPRMSFLSVERMCSLPTALVDSHGGTVAVVADPSEVPFRIPSFEDSRFGVLVRNAAGLAQPELFAPVLGSPSPMAPRLDLTDAWRYGTQARPSIPHGPPSHMKPGEPFTFRIRLVLRSGGWYPVFQHIAEDVYRFHDYRENSTCSLNETIENMVSLAMNDKYSGWVEDLKGFDYTTDVAETVKVVSALHPLSVAMWSDDREIFRRRALPIAEYLMSREKYLFAERPGIEHQSPSHFLRGPAAEVSELSALYLMSGKRSTVFRHYAEELNGKPRALNLHMVSEGHSWQNELALYRMTGEKAHLDNARRGADLYIRERIDQLPTDFSDVHVAEGGQFWTDFAPKWIDLYELYEETKEPSYLRAAAAGAREYATFAWMQPTIPDAEVTVNPHNQVGAYDHGTPAVPLTTPMRVPEQKVPAWRVSENGLIPEASTTYQANPAVFLAHHAAYMLRIGDATGDNLLKALARSAIIGRYSNFPGYTIRAEYTTIYARPDYPLRPFQELTYNPIFYAHIWPQIALVFDYLMADMEVRSRGRIAFPSRYAQGYAYLQSEVYGDRPGEFYGNHGVQLWMPAKLLRIDNPQINYLAGYDRNSLYVAFSNQSPRPVTATVRVNANLVPYSERQDYDIRTFQGGGGGPQKMQNGVLTVSVPASGLTAIAIEGIHVVPQFQQKILAAGSALPDQSFAETPTPFGKISGMLLSFGRAQTSAYIWLSATEDQVSAARLHYRQDDSQWNVEEDRSYPYDFSVPVGKDAKSFNYWIEAVPVGGGAVMKSDTVDLIK